MGRFALLPAGALLTSASGFPYIAQPGKQRRLDRREQRCNSVSTADHAPVRFDFDLEHFAIFCSGEVGEAQSTGLTVRRVDLNRFNARWQVGLHGTTMTRRARLLPL